MMRSKEIHHGSSGGGVSPALSALSAGGLRGVLRHNEPMSKHTSWRAGGNVERVYIPADLNDLASFMRSLPEAEAVYVVGLGSNLLVRDGGMRGTVVLLHGALNQIRIEPGKEELLYAEAGVASPKVARFAARHDLQGAEFLAGIPGTVGGALAMNAGCYGAETWEIVAKVLTLGRDGETHERLPADYDISYRHVSQKKLSAANQEWFVAAWFKLPKAEGTESLAKIKTLLQKRIDSQPLNQPNAGSVFRNPPGDHAARLIEACGLKGTAIGGAMVSPKHANFIVNTGKATAKDIEMLIEKVRDTVQQKQGVQLMPEVRIVGVQ